MNNSKPSQVRFLILLLQALLVTGGWDGSVVSSTEIYLSSQWSFAASLPSPNSGVRASTVQNSIYVSGK